MALYAFDGIWANNDYFATALLFERSFGFHWLPFINTQITAATK